MSQPSGVDVPVRLSAKADRPSGWQEKRRQEALERQRTARQRHISLTRFLHAQYDDQDEEELPGAKPNQAPGQTASSGDADMQAAPDQGQGDVAMGQHQRQQHQNRQHQHHRHRRGGGAAAAAAVEGEHPKQFYSKQLMQPEWLTEVPSDLGQSWYVMPRPEGVRCLVVSAGGRTVSRLRNGVVLHVCHTPLPDGSPATAGTPNDFCMLDCIYHEASGTYYTQDVLCWRGYALLDCTAEFRLFWLKTKVEEEDIQAASDEAVAAAAAAAATAAAAEPVQAPMEVAAPEPAAAAQQQQQQQQAAVGDADMGEGAASSAHSHSRAGGGASASGAPVETAGGQGQGQQQQNRKMAGPFRFRMLPVYPCTVEGLLAAHSAHGPQGPSPLHSGFVQDGLYLLHKDGQYAQGKNPTPLALLWKDAQCSRYLLDTDKEGGTLEHQQITLEYRMDATVATADEPPVVLGVMPPAFVAHMGPKLLRPGRLLRFSIRQGGIQFHEGRPCGADLHYEGTANQRRGRADAFSKILFQYQARTGAITLQHLLAAIASSTGAAPGGGFLAASSNGAAAGIAGDEMMG